MADKKPLGCSGVAAIVLTLALVAISGFLWVGFIGMQLEGVDLFGLAIKFGIIGVVVVFVLWILAQAGEKPPR